MFVIQMMMSTGILQNMKTKIGRRERERGGREDGEGNINARDMTLRNLLEENLLCMRLLRSSENSSASNRTKSSL